jgi:protein TonB
MTLPAADIVEAQSEPAVPRGGRSLPAVRMPVGKEDRKKSAAVSFLLHALILVLVLKPVIDHDQQVIEKDLRAGGPGPAGGGGGGRRGTGGVQERVAYVRAMPAPTPQVVVPPAEVLPVPPPVVVPPVEQVKPLPPIDLPKMDVKVAPAQISVPAASMVTGVGGGSGRDGSIGDGPGRGGGVGSGVGTGRGSAVGPGTGGGGTLQYYPPSPIELFIPPLPMPSRVRGFHLVAEFDVDSTGRVVGRVKFNETRDGDYNKKLREVLQSFRFRPATTLDGRPIRAPYQIVYDF